MWSLHETSDEPRTGPTMRVPTNGFQPSPSTPLNPAQAQILTDLNRHPLPPERPQPERVWSRGSSYHLLPERHDDPCRFPAGLVAGAWVVFALGLLPLHDHVLDGGTTLATALL